MLAWTRRGMPTSAGGAGGALGVIADLFDPGGARGREEMQPEHEIAMPAPTPGDKLLRDGKVTIVTTRQNRLRAGSPSRDADPSAQGGGSGI